MSMRLVDELGDNEKQSLWINGDNEVWAWIQGNWRMLRNSGIWSGIGLYSGESQMRAAGPYREVHGITITKPRPPKPSEHDPADIARLERELEHADAIAAISVGQDDRADNVAYREQIRTRLQDALNAPERTNTHMTVRVTTIHYDPAGGCLPVLYCRCGQTAIQGREIIGTHDYVCPDGHGWVGNIRHQTIGAEPDA